MAGGMTITITERGKRTLRKFGKLGRKGREAMRDGLEQGAIAGATFAFRAFRNRKQWGGEAWPDNQGRYAAFKENVLKQRPAIPGQLTGELKNSMQIQARTPEPVVPIPMGYQTRFGTNLPYAARFTTGGSRRHFNVQYGGDVYHFYQGQAPRPFMPRPLPFRQVVHRIMRERIGEAMREAMR